MRLIYSKKYWDYQSDANSAPSCWHLDHYNDVIMDAMACQITNLMIVYSTVYLATDQRKHQSSALLALCAGNSPVTGEFPTQGASNAENVSIWWRHHVILAQSGLTFTNAKDTMLLCQVRRQAAVIAEQDAWLAFCARIAIIKLAKFGYKSLGVFKMKRNMSEIKVGLLFCHCGLFC